MQDRKVFDEKQQQLLALETKYDEKDRRTEIPFKLTDTNGVYNELFYYMEHDLHVFAALAKWSDECLRRITNPNECLEIFKDYIRFQARLLTLFNHVEHHYKTSGYLELLYTLIHGIESLHKKGIAEISYHFSWTHQKIYPRHHKIFHQINDADVDMFLTTGLCCMLLSIENADVLDQLIPTFVENASCPYNITTLLLETVSIKMPWYVGHFQGRQNKRCSLQLK